MIHSPVCIAFTALLVAAAVTMCVTGSAAEAHDAEWSHTAIGDTVLRPFAHAPFPHASRANGYTYQGKLFSASDAYSDSTVGIFIPAGYRQADTVDYVVHFHGWGNHVSNVLERYRLREQFADSGTNAILIVPQGPRDASDSGGGKLENDKGAFKQLITEITDYVAQQGKIHTHHIGKIVLSTHSGGYAVTAAVLAQGGLTDHIKDVLLFDSSYGSLDRFAAWQSAGHGRRLVSIFTAHLAPANFILITLLQKSHTPFTAVMEPELNEALLTTRMALFIHTTDIEHDEIIQKRRFFCLFLKTARTEE